MNGTMQWIVQIFAAVVMIAIAVLNALAFFAVGWAVYHLVHDHWSMRQLWQHAKTRLSI